MDLEYTPEPTRDFHLVKLGPQHAQILEWLRKKRTKAETLRGLLNLKVPRRWDAKTRYSSDPKKNAHVGVMLTKEQAEICYDQNHSVQGFFRLALEIASGETPRYSEEPLHWVEKSCKHVNISMDPDMLQHWKDLHELLQAGDPRPRQDLELAQLVTTMITDSTVWDYGKPMNPRKTVSGRRLRFKLRPPYKFPEEPTKAFRAGLRALWLDHFNDSPRG